MRHRNKNPRDVFRMISHGTIQIVMNITIFPYAHESRYQSLPILLTSLSTDFQIRSRRGLSALPDHGARHIHMAIARPALTQSRPSAGECFVAADVGGTHVRLGLVRADAAGQPLDVVEYRKYRCADYPGLAEIIETYLRQLPGAAVTRGVIASAGHPLEDGHVIAA